MGRETMRRFFDKTPEAVIRQIYAKVPRNMISTFVATFVFGIIVHIYMFTNTIVNHDATMSLIIDMEVLIWGRWFIREASSLSGIFQIPVVIGVLSVALFSLSAAFTVHIFKIKNKLFGCIIGMVMVSIPIIAGLFAFMYTADAYAISLLLSVLCVFFAQKRGWRNGVLSAVLLMLSIAIYQVYCQFALTFFVILVILRVMENDVKIKDVFKEGIRYCMIFVVGMLAYKMVLEFILYVQKSDYASAPFTMSDDFVNRIRTVYSLFRRSMIEFRGIYGYEVVKYIYTASIFFSVCFITAYIGKQAKGNRFLRLCFAGVLFCCIPITQNIIVIATDTRVHNLTRYAFVLSVVFIIKLVDMVEISWRKNIYTWITYLSFGVVLWCNFLFTNECYLSLKLTNETSFALANRIVYRIETTPGWTEDMPVLIVGNYDDALDDGNLRDTKPILHSRVADVMGIVRLDYVYYRPYILYAYINDYIGKPLVRVTEEELQNIKQTGKVEEMCDFPAENSIQIIDGIMVVRLYEPDWSIINILNDVDNFIR